MIFDQASVAVNDWSKAKVSPVFFPVEKYFNQYLTSFPRNQDTREKHQSTFVNILQIKYFHITWEHNIFDHLEPEYVSILSMYISATTASLRTEQSKTGSDHQVTSARQDTFMYLTLL